MCQMVCQLLTVTDGQYSLAPTQSYPGIHVCMSTEIQRACPASWKSASGRGAHRIKHSACHSLFRKVEEMAPLWAARLYQSLLLASMASHTWLSSALPYHLQSGKPACSPATHSRSECMEERSCTLTQEGDRPAIFAQECQHVDCTALSLKYMQ